jgi:hypothetical protein
MYIPLVYSDVGVFDVYTLDEFKIAEQKCQGRCNYDPSGKSLRNRKTI